MKTIRQPVTRLDYCQYLLVSQINYTLTNFAEHTEQFSHDAVNRYLAGDQIRPRLVWENVQSQVVQTPDGYLVFDDTVVDKDFSSQDRIGAPPVQWECAWPHQRDWGGDVCVCQSHARPVLDH